jgi:hypothetical protein
MILFLAYALGMENASGSATAYTYPETEGRTLLIGATG